MKRGNAVASIIVVITLIAGTSVILFNPFRQSDELIDYPTNLFFLQSHWDREYYDILNRFFHSRDDTYWYYNFSSYPPVNTTLDKIIELYFNIKGGIEGDFLNINYTGTNLTYPSLSNPLNLDSFWIEQKEINVTFESINEKRIINTSHIYRAGDIFLLYKELYRWLGNDAGELSNELFLALSESGEVGCRFGICSCKDLDNEKDSENKQEIIKVYGITKGDIERAIQKSIDKLNNSLSLEGKFNCFMGDEKDIKVENIIASSVDKTKNCTPDEIIKKLGNQGGSRRGVMNEELSKDKPPQNKFYLDEPINITTYPPGQKTFSSISLPVTREDDERNTFAYYYNLHKNAMGEIPIICEHLNEDLELTVWIHFNVQRKCTDVRTLPTNVTAICPEEEDVDPPENGGGSNGCCEECKDECDCCCCCDEGCADECPCCDDCNCDECDCENGGSGEGPGDGPQHGDDCEDHGDCEGLECEICEMPYCDDEEGCICVPAQEGTPCGEDACKRLGCDENGACTIPLNIFNPDAPCNPHNIEQTSNLNQYCTLCGDQGECDKPAFNTTQCGDGQDCHVLHCNGTHSGENACNLIVPQDPGTECGICTVCSEDGHCNAPAETDVLCDEGEFCNEIYCNGTAFGEAACNLIEPKNINQECDTCTLCNEHGECNKPAGNTTICDSGYCGNYYCNETGTGEAACNDYREILSRKDDPCTSWKLGGDNPTHEATCTLCGEQGLCNKAADDTQICGTHDYCSQMYCSGNDYGTNECKVRSAIPNRINEYCKPGPTVSSGSQIDCAKCNSEGNCVATMGATCRTTTCGIYTCVGAGSSNCNLDVSESRKNDGNDCGDHNNCGEKQCKDGNCIFQGKLVDSRCNWNLDCNPYCDSNGVCRWGSGICFIDSDCGDLDGSCNPTTGACSPVQRCCDFEDDLWTCPSSLVCCFDKDVCKPSYDLCPFDQT